MKNTVIMVQDIPITITQAEMEDYICITDIAAAKSENSRGNLKHKNVLTYFELISNIILKTDNWSVCQVWK